MFYIFGIIFKLCQNLTETQDKKQFHSRKEHIHGRLHETVGRVKDGYNWIGMNKDIENFINKVKIDKKSKYVSKTNGFPNIIPETSRTVFERISFDIQDIPTKNYILTIHEELTTFTEAYPIKNKTSKSVVNPILLFFQHL